MSVETQNQLSILSLQLRVKLIFNILLSTIYTGDSVEVIEYNSP